MWFSYRSGSGQKYRIGYAKSSDLQHWQLCLEETGIDVSFYACRERGKDEFLPWDIVDMGVRRAHLWHEREQAYKAELSPDCRKQCTGCGALALMTEGGKCDA